MKGSWKLGSSNGASQFRPYWCFPKRLSFFSWWTHHLFGLNRKKTIDVKTQQHLLDLLHSYTPNSSTCEVLLGFPPQDFYNEWRNRDKITNKDAMEKRFRENHSPECQTELWKQSSLLSRKQITEVSKFMNGINLTNYTKNGIESYIQHRWYPIISTRNKTHSNIMQSFNIRPNLTCNQNMRAHNWYLFCTSWIFVENVEAESPLCPCQQSEEDAYHYFCLQVLWRVSTRSKKHEHPQQKKLRLPGKVHSKLQKLAI